MTKAHDIKELLGEHDLDTGQRRVLESLADKLEDAMTAPVPARPEFRAELRMQLLAQARRTLTPWYRRPAVWGSTMGMAAAVAVLAVGLQFYKPDVNQGGIPGPTYPPEVAQQPVIDGGDVNRNHTVHDPHLTSARNLPVVSLQDGPQPEGASPEPVSDAEVAQGLKIYKLTAQPSESVLTAMATSLGMTGQVRQTAGIWHVEQGSRSMVLRRDGSVEYQDRTAAGTQRIDQAGAQSVATSFLERAALPVPSSHGTVAPLLPSEGRKGFTVTMVPRVDGRPVVNGATIVWVTEQGAVFRAEATIQSGTEPVHEGNAITRAEALAKAEAGGGKFEAADLVLARTLHEATVYLQPYWRAYGTNAGGQKVFRYVPALKRQ